MEIFESKQMIEVIRKTTTRSKEILTGDQIQVKKYTATCQIITPNGALFLLDQYLDQAYSMNEKNTNRGGYEASDLRKKLQSADILAIFEDYRDRMQPFDNGDLLRLPFFGEIFGSEGAEYFEPDGCEQWPLMQDRKNRIAFRNNAWEWGWLQNKCKGSATTFCAVSADGPAASWGASASLGVRPAFLIV